MSYTIQPDDNLWNIATHFYGRGYLYKHIERRNPGVKIQPGKTLIIPAPPPKKRTSANTKLRSANPAPAGEATRSRLSSKMYTVKKGETLWEIARRAYGDPTQYPRIQKANPHLKSADDVKAGTKILIP